MKQRKIDYWAIQANRSGIRLSDFSEGEDVTGFRCAVRRVLGFNLSTDEAMEVIEVLCDLQTMGAY